VMNYDRFTMLIIVFLSISLFAACTNKENMKEINQKSNNLQQQGNYSEPPVPAPSKLPHTISPENQDQNENKKNQVNTSQEQTSSTIQNVKNDVRGIYVSANALHGSKWEVLLKKLQRTELNAVVIDVKNDSGRMTYPTQVELAQSIGADKTAKMKDMGSVLNELKEQNIYTIARIVTFKDPYLAVKKPEWALKTKQGHIWRSKYGVSWVDPYNENVWNYTISLAKEAVQLGFDEIQFDYVRFPEQVKTIQREVAFHNPRNESKDQVIQRFLSTARKEIHKVGGVVSADVFGLTTTAKDGMGIGQKWDLIAPEVDVISPMIYPSHYAPGSYGVKHPDLEPYRIIKEAVEDAVEKNKSLQTKSGEPVQLRPWIQDFTAKWVKPHQAYKRQEILEQIKALQEQGISQYLLWNPSCKYSL
jgi:hypothetical protein